MKKMIGKASSEQVKRINQLLGENRDAYTLVDVFNILPSKIRWNGMSGYLKISKFDIVYSSLETELEGKVVAMFSFLLTNENVFDAFITALEFFNKHKEDIEILEDWIWLKNN